LFSISTALSVLKHYAGSQNFYRYQVIPLLTLNLMATATTALVSVAGLWDP